MRSPRPTPLALRPLLLAALLLASSAAGADQPFVRPDEPGPFAVGRVELELVDEARGDRSMLVDVWYPANEKDARKAPASLYTLLTFFLESETAVDGPRVSNEGRFPLVVFSHGSGGVRFQSFFLTETLASHGFIVVSADHTGNTILDDLLGRGAPFLENAVNRVADVSFLIDTMLEKAKTKGDRFYRKLRRKRIGVAGHSFGGFTSLGSVAGYSGFGAGELPDDFGPVEGDSRIRALVPIAPVSTSFSDAEIASIRKPTLILGGTLDTTTPVEPQSARAFDGVDSAVVRVDLTDAVHFSFTNACEFVQVLFDAGASEETVLMLLGEGFLESCGDDVLSIGEAHRLTNLYTVAHFQRFLKKDRRYGAFLTGRYADRFEPDVVFDRRRDGVPFFGGSLAKLLRLADR